MKMYVEKTEGSFVEVKESIIIWNYKHAEYDFGKLQSKELKAYLHNVFENLPIEINETKNSVFVVPKEMKNETL